ncbi:hypothetical protein OS493_026331 [Desmophyllum pertusum]|uniref:Uncharacterized protein n=1 Tax=Desmophyllum pertusum TaxID=174260 RepID=A0A9W9ZLB7_9CNID|nr:hypothetical protein OS493_026331 [Desmophyllum pertusum]
MAADKSDPVSASRLVQVTSVSYVSEETALKNNNNRPNSSRKRRQDTTFTETQGPRQAKTQARSRAGERKTKYKLQDKTRKDTRHKAQDPSRKTQDTSFKKRPKQEDKTRHKLQDKTQAGEMYGHGMPTSRPSSTLNIPSSTLNGPSSALNETHFPIYGENIDYAIKIVEHFINFLPVRGENPYLEISGQFQPITCQQEDEGFINFNPTKTGQTSLSRRHVRPLDFQTGFGKLQIRFLKQVIFGKRQTMIRGDTSWPQMQHATVEDELQTVIDFLENIAAHRNLAEVPPCTAVPAGENVDYAIQIVEHFVNTFLSVGKRSEGLHTGAKPKPVKRVYSEGNFPPLDVPTGLRKLRIKFKSLL